MFYLRRLYNFVFFINNFGSKKGLFYTYNEEVASKDSDEVSSFVTDYIANSIPFEVKELHLLSDLYPGAWLALRCWDLEREVQ